MKWTWIESKFYTSIFFECSKFINFDWFWNPYKLKWIYHIVLSLSYCCWPLFFVHFVSSRCAICFWIWCFSYSKSNFNHNFHSSDSNCMWTEQHCFTNNIKTWCDCNHLWITSVQRSVEVSSEIIDFQLFQRLMLRIIQLNVSICIFFYTADI